MSPAPALVAGDTLCEIFNPSGILILLQNTAYRLQDKRHKTKNKKSREGALPVEQVVGEQPPNLNISDVIDAISRADPLFGAGVEMPRPPAPHAGQPFVRIVEQPASKALRFRYECEGRSAGSIPGVNSTPERKTYPTIEICGHKGPAIVVVSCVTREEPYKPHPHNLVGRERCENGVCTVKTTINEENPQVSFSNLGIQCVKRKDIADALKTRERLRVDPFRTGYNHRNQPQSIDLNAVRLCFQVFIHDERTGKIRLSLPPVVSDVIYDKKAMSDLVIMRLSQCSDFHKGGTELILLCEKVTREDIAVVFFQKEGEHVVWEESANIVLVHRQVAIAFHTPPYRDPSERRHVQVYLQLKRTSDNARSNAVPFEYIPEYQDTSYLKHKRLKTLSPSVAHQTYEQDRYGNDQHIKSEPRDKTPPHQMNSPLRVFSPPYENEQIQDNPYQWGMQGMSIAGPSHVSYGQDMQWSPSYVQLSPSMQSHSPNMSPNLQMTNLQNIQPNLQTLSPNMQSMPPMSPNMQMSPMGQVMPSMGRISPMTHGGMSPNMGQMSPSMGHVSPGMGHISPNLMQQQQQQQQELLAAPASDSPSLSGLLLDRGDVMPQLNSGELSGLSSLLERGPDLSDSLNRLSTSDLLH
ncbi:transcription factor p65-like isoform X6 [Vanessa tameamea]|uniref:Transcription factor p65-like isoform X6 n=1 Tax=Vanessa tameamea TaxID=334116 RepID=A0A8B8HS84_VANTA|nr:transcription factor p65-like isoform X6 [Vanessa tameamea]